MGLRLRLRLRIRLGIRLRQGPPLIRAVHAQVTIFQEHAGSKEQSEVVPNFSLGLGQGAVRGSAKL